MSAGIPVIIGEYGLLGFDRSTDVIEQGETPTDAAIALDLKGATVTAVANGTEELVRGEDYTVNGDQLTLAAATLAGLTESQQHGVNATLTVEFSRGVPWDVHVITYDTPVLRDATGSTSSLALPAAFNGDRLATMEAFYADGTIAGPQNWTSYKEFGYTFSPDYAANRITLTQEFFAGVRDNSTVNLTFHFWSGETVEYTLTRSGSTVTGTAG
ncbi:X2-like carbohydrate binding domain-containing protein [Streptomyces sp. B6B3]|uniref:X2-like carbohydrate binding domain-containing protein n=1 Tax=Streptomyces sp. B6B3 TaxID=3153570 RepID=UPI00325DA752